ncbi:peptidoglycan DD-metalloendopeptidase family protein [Croceitalea sp. MTPC9]|uniref:murein hydrolase activator EnvC family protein n=1 Tax=unclassified Croceitalea TaxID=2632280 RepID=UPI002B3C5137|nr:peptidoglycan DD-metalloendopeptidase family protein [Croceitalea sp. MTPC6]GMN16540.1 peptidoglycan DD-metalloendopeptidase family protein [Croceitalea sp. MTPC9]
MQKSFYRHIILLGLAILFSGGLSAQTSQQKALEAKRAKLQKEIREMNRLLSAQKQEKGNVLEQMEALDRKINVRQELIRVTNQQSNLLNRQINANVRSIGKLREDLELLKDDYAQLIQKSYQNKTQNNRLMFLLSSDNFFQAFKRLQYIKQYTKHRKQQGESIEAKTEELSTLNKDLVEQRKIKDQLLVENRRAKNDLSKEIGSQRTLLQSIKQNESKYTQAIDKKKKESRRIDREIEKLIRSAIASSNKKSGSSNTTSFALTPEAKLIANNFSSNKGKLIWPVEKGIKSQGFGVYADKVYPGIKHQNNGVTITTDKGGQARAIFEGEVITIFTNKMGVKGIYLRHGNYISMYYNLSKTYVQKGDKVAAKEALGEIYTNRFSGVTNLKFYLYQDTKKLNPEHWIYQL